MALDVLYFGALRDALGRDGERVHPPSHVVTVQDLIAWLVERGGAYRAALAGPSVVEAAVEAELTGPEGSIFGAREVALFPPRGAL